MLPTRETPALFNKEGMEGIRLSKLENKPSESWNSAKRTAITAIISTVAGALD